MIGRKSRWLFAFRITSLLVGGGIRPTLSGFISNILTQIWSWKGRLCTLHEVNLLACCNRDFPVISACLITDKLTRWHVQTSSNLMAFHDIRIILSRSFFSGFKTTRYVFPMSIRIIKRFKIFLSPPPQNAHESTGIQFSLLISTSKLGTQYVHVPRRHTFDSFLTYLYRQIV